MDSILYQKPTKDRINLLSSFPNMQNYVLPMSQLYDLKRLQRIICSS
jgi:hypothetical protein